MKALLVGYGKMGKAIEAVLLQRGHGVAGRFGGDERDLLEGEERRATLRRASSETSVRDRRRRVRVHDARRPRRAGRPAPPFKKIPVVSGTTGWDVAPAVRLAREQKVPFLHSPNFSIGVAALRRAVAAAAAAARAVPRVRAGDRRAAPLGEEGRAFGDREAARVGRAEPRSGGRGVPIVVPPAGRASRESTSVFFEGADETVELVHRARSRAIFAAGRGARRRVDARRPAAGPRHVRRILRRRRQGRRLMTTSAHAGLFTFSEPSRSRASSPRSSRRSPTTARSTRPPCAGS